MSKLDETSRKVQAAASAPQDEVTAARDIRTLVAFLDSIIDNIPAMVFVKNAETLRYERFNRAGEENLYSQHGDEASPLIAGNGLSKQARFMLQGGMRHNPFEFLNLQQTL